MAVSEETRRLQVNSGAGRHSRLPDLTRLHRACLATLIALVAQFALGMWVNLYAAVPAADQHAGIVQDITNGPLLLTVHALLGTFLIVATIVLLIRAIKVGDRTVTVLAAVGLAAVVGAFGAGEFFVRDGESKMSLWMAVLTGIALLAYIYIQTLTSAVYMAHARRRAEGPSESTPHLPYPPPAARPRPAGATATATAPWPDQEYGAPMGRRQPGYGPGMPGSAPAYRRAASGPQPAYPGPASGPQPAYPGPRSGPQPAYPGPRSGPQPAYPGPASGPQPVYPRAGPLRARPRDGSPQPWPGNSPWPWQPGPRDVGYPEEWRPR